VKAELVHTGALHDASVANRSNIDIFLMPSRIDVCFHQSIMLMEIMIIEVDKETVDRH
jgi:hypothetical protein